MSRPDDDPLRAQLVDAAARVFASRGYSGTKILDIVKEAGLSSGAVYGRFRSKDELLLEAITTHARAGAGERSGIDLHVVDQLVAGAERLGELDAVEAVQLEAYVAARREPEVAAAIAKARRHWRGAIEPTVQRAVQDGTVAADADIAAILYFLEAVHLGLLLLRGAGIAPADAGAWKVFVRELMAALPQFHGGAGGSGVPPLTEEE